MGDRWIFVGEVYLVEIERYVLPVLPDFDEFFDSRSHLDDGTDLWRRWGPMVN
jgi:hypothetical protein